MTVKGFMCVLTLQLLQVFISGLSENNDMCIIDGKCLPCPLICKTEVSYNETSPFCGICPDDMDIKNQTEINCPEGEYKYKPILTPFKCFKKCPVGTFKTVDHTCVDSCIISGYPVEYNNTCYRQCPGDLYEELFHCVKTCFEYYTIDKRCVSDCPKELPFLIENNNTCTDLCPNNTQVVAQTCKGPYTYYIMVPILVTIVVFLVIFFTFFTCYYMKTCPRKLKSEEDMVRHLLSANDEDTECDERPNIV